MTESIPPRARKFRFGQFELDVRAGELRKQGIRLRLREQPLQILLLLLERPGEVVVRAEIRQRLWPDQTVVEFDHGINNAVRRLRDALGESAEKPRYVETVASRGYRFLGQVETVEAPSSDAFEPPTRQPKSDTPPLRREEPSTEQVQGAAGSAGPSTRKTVRRFPTLALVPMAALIIIGLAVCVRLLFYRAKPAVTGTDTIVLSDFANSTGDPVFDDTLKQALAAELQQSPFWHILPDRQVSETLKLMGRPADPRLDAHAALDVCQRTASRAVLSGSIDRLGSQYVLGLTAVDCQTGGSLVRESVQSAKKEDVLVALGKAGRKVRTQLGESLRSVRKFDTNLEQATTASLDALKAYSRGRKALFGSADSASAAPLFQQAIRIDPDFAMAYLSLGICYLNLGDSRSAENITKAYQIRGRVSDWERLAIEERYFNSVTGDLLKARQTTELWARTYPRDPLPVNILTEIDCKLGQYDNALAEATKSVRLDPGSGLYRWNLVAAYSNLSRLDEARASALSASRQIDPLALHSILYLIAFQQEDANGIAQQSTWFTATPGMLAALLQLEAGRAVYAGKLTRARSISRHLLVLAGDQEKEVIAGYEAETALREAVFGNALEARRHAMAAVRNSTGALVESSAALALALAGDTVAARTLARDLAIRFPENTIVRFNFLPAIEARLSANPNEAIEVLRAAIPYELGDSRVTLLDPPMSLYAIYVRGQMLLAAHRGREAAAEFQKIIQHRWLVLNEPIDVPAHLGLARAYALQGDTANAYTAYQHLLALWKDDDIDLPLVKEAKFEYQRLKPGNSNLGSVLKPPSEPCG